MGRTFSLHLQGWGFLGVSSGYYGLPLPVQRHTNLSLVCEYSKCVQCMCVWLCPVMGWSSVQGVPCIVLQVPWERRERERRFLTQCIIIATESYNSTTLRVSFLTWNRGQVVSRVQNHMTGLWEVAEYISLLFFFFFLNNSGYLAEEACFFTLFCRPRGLRAKQDLISLPLSCLKCVLHGSIWHCIKVNLILF